MPSPNVFCEPIVGNFEGTSDAGSIFTYLTATPAPIQAFLTSWVSPALIEVASPPVRATVSAGILPVQLFRRAQVEATITCDFEGRAIAFRSLDPVPPPIATLRQATLAGLLDPAITNPALTGAYLPRGFTTPMAFLVRGVDIAPLSAYFVATYADGVEALSYSSGNGIYLQEATEPDASGVSTIAGAFEIGATDTALLTAGTHVLTYQFWLDDGAGRKYVCDAGRFTVGDPSDRATVRYR